MKVLHVVPEINEANGVYQVARDLARESGGELIDCSDCSIVRLQSGEYDEVWVHGMWLPREWKACWLVLRSGKRLVRMTHGSLSPVYLGRQGKWKKRLVGPIERWLLRRCDRIVATCEAEAEWVRAYEPRLKVELTDLKRFFDLKEKGEGRKEKGDGLHLLYLGRRHPLKGVEFLEQAVEEIRRKEKGEGRKCGVELRVVSDHFGEELEKDWAWCDVLVLPTLSENFGRVVAEALERGKRVITTDGAPAWQLEGMRDEGRGMRIGYGGRLIYLTGFRDGTDEERVRLLKEALRRLKVEG